MVIIKYGGVRFDCFCSLIARATFGRCLKTQKTLNVKSIYDFVSRIISTVADAFKPQGGYAFA